ncbi:hypothetical protein [Helicobacter cinaedi]|uniref:hypothetical protein n=1 Tax=Helicobacter cinaedi TaxID=213 RepID=UPI000CF13737|nr:hypothetical protein [Helicobacter cinaedi]QOQ95384.1 hypothetical protein HW245_06845 [Helicobacter cinaedi]
MNKECATYGIKESEMNPNNKRINGIAVILNAEDYSILQIKENPKMKFIEKYDDGLSYEVLLFDSYDDLGEYLFFSNQYSKAFSKGMDNADNKLWILRREEARQID